MSRSIQSRPSSGDSNGQTLHSSGAEGQTIAAPAENIGEAIWRTLSRKSTYNETIREKEQYDTEAQPPPDHFGDGVQEWAMAGEIRGIKNSFKACDIKSRKLGVTWKNLTVEGISADLVRHENALSQFNFPQLIKESRAAKPTKIIINNSSGCVKPGEMLLVLGRPGSGCTTLLNMLANKRAGYANVTGDVRFGDMDAKEARKYRGEIVMNSEEELFFPTLTVGQTMDFATKMKIPAKRPEDGSDAVQYQQTFRDFLLRSMGIAHTVDTKVGDAYVRGVSGGERKRVSIIECLASQGSIFCWDNSTRGLDANTANEWAKAIRAMTNILGLSTIVTLYQAGNGIYNQFDKVLVLDEGKQVFYGNIKEARPFMEAQGFICDDAANTGDFLTGVSVPTERKIRPEFQDRFPRSPTELRAAYDASDIKRRMDTELGFPSTDEVKENVLEFKTAVQETRHKGLPKDSPFTVPFTQQVRACVVRQYQILWGDRASLVIKQGSTLLQALVFGSLFYNAPDNSGGLFIKGGAIFFSVLLLALQGMSEVTDSFSGRPVLAKHKEFAFYHPAAVCIGQVMADLPLYFVQVSLFAIVIYFMVGLKETAGAFFTYWIFLYTTGLTMTAYFRFTGAAFASFDAASKVSGFSVTIFVTYVGYMIAKPQMHPWFVWLYWIDPLAYAFEGMLSNEFKDTVVPCVGPNLVPSGPGYASNQFAACTGVRGASVGAISVTGEEYLKSLSYSSTNIWRNYGILAAWWVFFVMLTIFFTSRWQSSAEQGNMLVVPREKGLKAGNLPRRDDEEAQEKDEEVTQGSSSSEESADKELSLERNTSVFTWKNLSYTVRTPSGDRVLLDNVQGWVKPGMLGALMGSSGAGKTTLMDVLAQRKTEGTIRGSILVDGKPLPITFQRSAGYCEQLDVHEPFATVREALEFSALLRQKREIPKEEKLRYVNTVIDLLELHDLENTLIGRIGSGLSVEQRKRVTIGVELVAKPSILIFLDEPTSGLDGQSAFNTLRFLKKLTAAGQAVLCTIHQPSAQLFAQFDTLLLLTHGGKTVYFGDIGDESATIKEYFARNGAPCPATSNPAEHMIDVCSGELSRGKDWVQIWQESPEHETVTQELDRIIADTTSKPNQQHDDGLEFATSLWTQTKIVTQRMNVALYRNTDYVNNKFALHVGTALFVGFSFWQIGNTVNDLELGLFAMFNFIFVAPGVIAQLQPLFIERRDIYDAREKKSKMYSWIAFVTGLIVSEFPYLIICAILFFLPFYWTVGFPSDSNKAGAIFFVMLLYEFFYTGLGQMIAAYAPNAVFASLMNPLVIGTVIGFCGVLVPYSQIQPFWRYWLYYLNPYSYLMGALLTFGLFDWNVECGINELAIFDTPSGQTCQQYLSSYLSPDGLGHLANLLNPAATSGCRVCQYSRGSDYLVTLNIPDYYIGWRDTGICVIFVISTYALVYALMKLRTKSSKTAE
jgi:ATP-binding cassette subfamily G (WHITE) protein 2 (SNQ2)